MSPGFSEKLLPFLQCPCCFQESFTYSEGDRLVCNNIACFAHANPFEIVNNQPLLIDFRGSLFKKENFHHSKQGEVVARKKGGVNTAIKRFLWGDSPQSEKQIAKLIEELEKLQAPANVLIVGGGTVGLGTNALYDHPSINILSFDVYITGCTHFVADAHNIPIKSESIDAVIVQAVLEHVLDPVQVVAEIKRVLKPGGYVYAETPFMQQVHEGAYDFTRYTESGHRWLFKDFSLLQSGAVRGVGVSLIWSIRYFFAALFRSKALGTIAAVFFFWLRFLEKLIPEKNNIQGASCFYFLGRKDVASISQTDIISFYERELKKG